MRAGETVRSNYTSVVLTVVAHVEWLQFAFLATTHETKLISAIAG